MRLGRISHRFPTQAEIERQVAAQPYVVLPVGRKQALAKAWVSGRAKLEKGGSVLQEGQQARECSGSSDQRILRCIVLDALDIDANLQRMHSPDVAKVIARLEQIEDPLARRNRTAAQGR